MLLVLCTIVITLSSLYSKAWSYGGVGINIRLNLIIAFNIIIICGTFAAYLISDILAFTINVLGSILGTIGVMICINESIWLLKNRTLLKEVLWRIRYIDVISFTLSAILMVVFWLIGGNWILNNVFAICTIISAIKIFKIRTFKDGILLLMSLLII